MERQNRIVTRNWDLYDTRHVVYRPIGLSAEELKRGYDWAYEAFYEWGSIVRAASAHESVKHRLKHLAYSAGWKKFERAWNLVIRVKQLSQMRPLLEAVLSPVRRKPGGSLEGSEAREDGHTAAAGRAGGRGGLALHAPGPVARGVSRGA
jgi:hypothetical protein